MAKITGAQARALFTPEGLDTLSGADILNMIRKDATEQYKNLVPEATNSNIGDVFGGIEKLQVISNEFISALVDRITLVIIKKKLIRNPLAKFKRADLLFGGVIEEIFVDLVQAKEYDPEVAEKEVFKREIPDTKVYFHSDKRQQFYKQTIQDSSLKQAFTDYNAFDNFLSNVINSVYNSAELDEFRWMMKTVDVAIEKGDMKPFEIELTGSKKEDALNLVELMRTIHTRMTMPMGSRQFNSAGVHTVTDESDVHILMLPETNSSIDVHSLASAFNMDKASFIGNRTLVDGFKDPDVLAVIMDKNFFMCFDMLSKMESIRNPDGLYWNYSLHQWQIHSYSKLENAVVIKRKKAEIPPEGQTFSIPNEPTSIEVKTDLAKTDALSDAETPKETK